MLGNDSPLGCLYFLLDFFLPKKFHAQLLLLRQIEEFVLGLLDLYFLLVFNGFKLVFCMGQISLVLDLGKVFPQLIGLITYFD